MQSLACDNEAAAVFAPTMVRHGLQVPYLLNGLLALAALHLSHTRPAKRDHYRFHATQLQTHAISIFNETDRLLSSEECTSIFLFSAVLGTHMFCETLIFRDDDDVIVFLSRFVQCARLQRAVRTVVGQAQAALDQSDLGAVWRQGASLPQSDTPLCEEYTNLKKAIIDSKLGSSLTYIYTNTIECLQLVAEHGDSSRAPSGTIVAWPVLVPEGYLECLMLRRPEALVILAHYAVLLHQCRRRWIFGDSGSFLIESIISYLGSEWDSWMGWPQHALQCSAED